MNTQILANQFPQLHGGQVYVDWIGAALPPAMLIDGWHDYLRSNLLGNPHSHHAPSSRAMDAIMETRAAILAYFKADPSEYEVIFTSGATAAIRIMQHFLFEGGEYLLTADNHNSVNGIREDAKRQGAVVRYAPINQDLTLDDEALRRMLNYPRSQGNKLFAMPAKSNYSGISHNLDYVSYAQERGWTVLLDAAAYSSNKRLDMSVVKPDFMPISFYKLFGYPTGVGCLLIKKSAYAKLNKRWFAGGSILLVSVMKDFYAHEALGYARFEDGTVNFTGIPAIRQGLKFMESLGDIHPYTNSIAEETYDRLSALNEGGNTVLIHNPRGTDVVTFSMKRGVGQIVDAWVFEQFANARGVYVRTGCFCNPGVNECVFGYKIDAYEALYNSAIRPDAITIDNLRKFSGDTPIGAIRASFGYANRPSDAKRVADVAREFLRSL